MSMNVSRWLTVVGLCVCTWLAVHISDALVRCATVLPQTPPRTTSPLAVAHPPPPPVVYLVQRPVAATPVAPTFADDGLDFPRDTRLLACGVGKGYAVALLQVGPAAIVLRPGEAIEGLRVRAIWEDRVEFTCKGRRWIVCAPTSEARGHHRADPFASPRDVSRDTCR